MFARAMSSAHHPVLAQIIPIRRCNLSCAYCNEYDSSSAPVPTEEMLRRVDRLAALRTTIITLSGGEPLLHPELSRIVARIRGHGILATLITNGYALVVVRRARELGFTATVGLLHDHSGQIRPLTPEQTRVYEELARPEGSLFSFAHNALFQKNLVAGIPNEWQCRAGSRYLYVCEDGLVHWCSQQRGYPGIPLERYGREDLERESRSRKPCAPFCTVNCVHQTAVLDGFRERPQATLAAILQSRRERDPSFHPPLTVRLLSWMFMESRQRRVFAGLATQILRLRS